MEIVFYKNGKPMLILDSKEYEKSERLINNLSETETINTIVFEFKEKTSFEEINDFFMNQNDEKVITQKIYLNGQP